VGKSLSEWQAMLMGTQVTSKPWPRPGRN